MKQMRKRIYKERKEGEGEGKEKGERDSFLLLHHPFKATFLTLFYHNPSPLSPLSLSSLSLSLFRLSLFLVSLSLSLVSLALSPRPGITQLKRRRMMASGRGMTGMKIYGRKRKTDMEMRVKWNETCS